MSTSEAVEGVPEHDAVYETLVAPESLRRVIVAEFDAPGAGLALVTVPCSIAMLNESGGFDPGHPEYVGQVIVTVCDAVYGPAGDAVSAPGFEGVGGGGMGA